MKKLVLIIPLLILFCKCNDKPTAPAVSSTISTEAESTNRIVTLNAHFRQFDNDRYGFIVEFLETYLAENIYTRSTSDTFWRKGLNNCVNMPGIQFFEYFSLVQEGNSLFLNGISEVEKNLYEIHLTVIHDVKCIPIISFYINYLKGEDGGSFIDPTCINIKPFEEKKVNGTKNISVLYNDSNIPTIEELKKISSFVTKMDDFFDKTVEFKILSYNSTDEFDNLRGFDYTYRTWSLSTKHTGAADTHNNYLHSINSSFYYPHEIVHFYTADLSCHMIFDEGIATYFGGSRSYSLDELILELKKNLINDSLTIPSDITKWGEMSINEHHGLIYSLGGLLIKKAFEKGGDQKIISLLSYGKTDEDFFRALDLELGLKADSLSDSLKSWIISN